MKNKYFFGDWDYKLTPDFLERVIHLLGHENAPTIKSFSIGDYREGILSFGTEENGLYFFFFPDETYYIGAATSCTLLERLAKHLDGRFYGTFNTVLRKIGQDSESSNHFTANQQFFLEAKMLFIPITSSKMPEPLTGYPKDKKIINCLEEDIIYIMHKKGLKLRNHRIPKRYSGYFYNE
jgi:hypothetical protein